MRVLWFEVTVPAIFKSEGAPVAGWQDSLEDIVKENTNIELAVAFEGKTKDKKMIDGVTYYSLCPELSLKDKLKLKYSWQPLVDIMIPLALDVVKDFNPDVIHVFGTEWYWPQIVKYTDKPVVAHLQGSIPPYYNAQYPPFYNKWSVVFSMGLLCVRNQLGAYLARKKYYSRYLLEEDNLRHVSNYMGRTKWDRQLVKLYNPQSIYYYCSEALRPDFIANNDQWKPQNRDKIKLITTGCGVLLKGLDTIIRTAVLLKERNVNFEWRIAGSLPAQLKKLLESQENVKLENLNIVLLGYTNSDKLKEELLDSDMYVHTSYCDNSPNSICEAQYLGLPIIATYVGGIPSLIENEKEGVLLPANAPYEMAQTIIELFADKDRRSALGLASRNCAVKRHDQKAILNDLLTCYKSLIC
ncbi:MAG TPA: glycosyltransferase [Paludibacteraceae bacterium]|nr:glycosyltransferase [Paludibacteraceae bacterium]